MSYNYDLNKWAKDITLNEGKKMSLSIAQIKEVLRIVLNDLKVVSLSEIAKIISKK